MNCSVPGCLNDSRNTSSSSQGITFHKFPNDPSLCVAWLQAIGKDGWVPNWRSAVCSEHFLEEDFYESKNGLRKVKVGAVPIIVQDIPVCEHFEEDTLKVCRICLAMDTKLYSIWNRNLFQAYKEVTGIQISEEDGLPQTLCSECAQRLINCYKFRRKSKRAHILMSALMEKENQVTNKNILSINRQKYKLVSHLTVKNLGTNNFDFEIEETYKTDVDTDSDDIKVTITDVVLELKREIDDDIDENDISDKQYSTDNKLLKEVTKNKKVETQKSTKKVKSKVNETDSDSPKIYRKRKVYFSEDISMFTIHQLSIEEQLNDILKRKESSNFKNAGYKCNECYKGFVDEEAYRTHLRHHTTDCGKFMCNICKMYFKNENVRRKHITANHARRFSCNECAFVTNHRDLARAHSQGHRGLAPRYKCPHCTWEFGKFTSYMGHLRIKHPSDFVCQLCGYSFVSEKGISLHKKLKHRLENLSVPDDGPYCELCDIRFKNSDALNRHLGVSTKHTVTDKDSRQPNMRSQKRKLDKREIAKRKEEEREPINCEQCDARLDNYRAYHAHFTRYHPDRNRTLYSTNNSTHMCEVCGRLLQSHSLLQVHKRLHTGEKPFKCDFCDKSFRIKQFYTSHRRVHTGEKVTYPCKVCEKEFSTPSNRLRHMLVHTDIKPFKCDICDKTFKQGSEKRSHMSYIHHKNTGLKRSRRKRVKRTTESTDE